jgi:hypothetical protein
MCQELLGNATVVDDAIKFVSDRSKDKPKLRGNSNESDKEESKLIEISTSFFLHLSHNNVVVVVFFISIDTLSIYSR